MKRSKPNRPKDCPYVGKGGLKLEFALKHFGLDVSGLVAADLGCHIGGFTDCLLKNGVARVYSVDTAYGQLAWVCRTDPRVVLCERTNAIHWRPPEAMDFVVSDLGWTGQGKSLPIIVRILKPEGRALSLVKPQYESPKQWLERGVLPEGHLEDVMATVRAVCPPELRILGEIRSPYVGSGGNNEVWLLLEHHLELQEASPDADAMQQKPRGLLRGGVKRYSISLNRACCHAPWLLYPSRCPAIRRRLTAAQNNDRGSLCALLPRFVQPHAHSVVHRATDRNQHA